MEQRRSEYKPHCFSTILTSADDAASLLNQGHPVAIPTETVYGLAAPIHDENCIQQVFTIKNRPLDNPLIVHLAHPKQLQNFCDEFPPKAETLIEAFWPGSLTIVLPIRKNALSPLITANQSTAAFRIPNHPLTLDILAKTGPLVAPSANLSGYPSPTRLEHVLHDYSGKVPILNGGVCKKGLESTIVGFFSNQWMLLRKGALHLNQIEAVLNSPIIADHSNEKVPGKKYRHYAPKCRLHLVFEERKFGNKILGFEDLSYPPDANILHWGKHDNIPQLQRNLYHHLRMLDQLHWDEAWIDCRFLKKDHHSALLERLKKASFNHDPHMIQ